MSTRTLVLHDHEINLYDRDFATVQDNMCLNDMIMYFKIRCLERKYQDLLQKKFFYILMPQVSQVIQTQTPETSKLLVPKASFEDYKLLFFPISDFSYATKSATHWSLLYVDNRNGEKRIRHYDSHSQLNIKPAIKFASLISQIYQLPSADVEMLNCSTQQNMFDCGIYVLAYIDNLIEKLGDHEAADKILTPEYIYQYRKDIREYIPKRAKELEENNE